MPTDAEILELFDREQRIEIEFPGLRREATAEIVRHVSLGDAFERGFVLYSRLTEATVDQAIRQQIAYFERIGQSFEWKVYDHDRPADLRQRLAAAGFEVEDPEAILVLDLREMAAPLKQPPTHDIRRIGDPSLIADVLSVQQQVWGQEFQGLGQRLRADLSERPDYLSVYVAYVEQRPVCAAWIYFHEGSRFASLWGGSTLPDYRGRGIYTAMVAARAQEALRRGFSYLTIDASPMSRPIVQRLGFRLLTHAHPCIWNVTTVAQQSQETSAGRDAE